MSATSKAGHVNILIAVQPPPLAPPPAHRSQAQQIPRVFQESDSQGEGDRFAQLPPEFPKYFFNRPSGDEVLIRRCLDCDADARYHVEGALSQTVTTPEGTDKTRTVSVTAEFEIQDDGEVKDGQLPIVLKIKDLNILSSPPILGDVKRMKATMHAKVDELNNLTDVSLEGVSSQEPVIASLIARLAQGPGTFASEKVKPGDSWTVTEQASLLGSKKLEYKLHYDGEKKIDDESYHELSADEEIPLEIDLGSMEDPGGGPPGATSMVMKGSVHITAHVLLDEDGMVYSMEFETKAEVTVDSPKVDGQMHLNTDEVLKITKSDD